MLDRASEYTLFLSGAGIAQTIALQNMDAQGQLGKPPVPALGGLGTSAGLLSLILGGGAALAGIAGAMGRGPTRMRRDWNQALIAYGATTLGGQAVATALQTPAVKVPYALAARARVATDARQAGFPRLSGDPHESIRTLPAFGIPPRGLPPSATGGTVGLFT